MDCACTTLKSLPGPWRDHPSPLAKFRANSYIPEAEACMSGKSAPKSSWPVIPQGSVLTVYSLSEGMADYIFASIVIYCWGLQAVSDR